MSRSRVRFGLAVLLAAVLMPMGTAQNSVGEGSADQSSALPSPGQTNAQTAPGRKKLLPAADYRRVEALSALQISRDGRWVSAVSTPVEGDGQLYIKNSDDPKSYVIPNGSGLQFADSSEFATYLIAPPKAVADRLRAERKPVTNRLGIRRLLTGEERQIEGVEQVNLLRGTTVALLRRSRPPEEREARQDFTLIDLRSGDTLTLGNVANIAWNDSEGQIALHIKANNGEEGVQIFDVKSRALRTLTWGKESIAQLRFARKAPVVAWLAGTPNAAKDGNAYRIAAARLRPAADQPAFVTYVPAADEKFPKGYRISDAGNLALNDAGTIAIAGISAWNDKPKPLRPDETANVEIWNSRDLEIVPQQKVRYPRNATRTETIRWKLGDPTVTRITQPGREFAVPMDQFEKFVVIDPRPYESSVSNGWRYHDLVLVDGATGDRKVILAKTHWTPEPSPTGRYAAQFHAKHWHLIDVRTGNLRTLTDKLRPTFEDLEDDHLSPERPPAAGVTWFAEDAAMILSDGYDLFRAKPTDSTPPVALTQQRKFGLVHRVLDVRSDPEGLRADQPQLIAQLDDNTKASGALRLDPDGKITPLVSEHAQIGNFRLARDTDRVLFTMGRFDQSPSVYVTNLAFSAAKPIVKSNAWLSEFHWGKSELVTYRSRWGKPLQGVLIYPANYDPARRYPMITYIYERLSDSLHSFIRPIPWSAYNEQVWSQNGYFVFKPDIAYRDSQPGQDAVDCLEPAVQAVIDRKLAIDPERVGLIGHSWGGYQTAFVTTVSKRFRVGVAGAPLTELTSMYNLVYWNSGTPNGEIFETSQGRFAKPFWEMPEKYFANSPVWQAHRRTAPLLMAFGDADGAVDYRQGVMFYNTLRRMGKQCVMLVYPGENHGLARRPNQQDYANRVRHFLDVHLKGERAEAWVTDGQPYRPIVTAPPAGGS
ncbi:MAG: alpha/beta fold hydrolase [Fimbriimonadaceae bacterium]|nr:alpha/beta fold hydrolase [Fimbriimonadaceae bacterium]